MAKDNLIAGNYFDKFQSRNPIVRWLLAGYFQAFDRMLAGLHAEAILEVGCGEGFVVRRLRRRFPMATIVSMDLSLNMVRLTAKQNEQSLSICASASDLPYKNKRFDLVVCVEVLEHLVDPKLALCELKRVGKGYVLVSVPNEPLWRFLNVARGSYLRSWGNTPGHVQHWRPRQFLRLLQEQFEVEQVGSPLPWFVALCKVNHLGIH